MSDSATIELRYPVQMDGAQVAVLHMRRPTVRDLLTARKAAGDDDAREVRLLANLCSVAPADMESLDMADYGRVQEAYAGFLSRP